MGFFKVTNMKTGDAIETEFNGTIHQFVKFYGKGFGMPDGERVEEIAALSSEPVVKESKSVTKRKAASKGE